jgi:hypothetical protein
MGMTRAVKPKKRKETMRNNKTVLALILTAALSVSAYSQQYDSENDFAVQREGNGITITKYIGAKQEVRIPPSIQNLPVTGIGDWAFALCFSLTGITIPDIRKTARFT